MNKLSEAKENNKDQQNEKEFWSGNLTMIRCLGSIEIK